METAVMDAADQQHFAWLARTFGRTDYLPLSPGDLQALAQAGEVIEKYPDTHLFREGEVSRYSFVVQQGRVELYRGRKPNRRVVGRVGEGSVIGDIAMFRDRPYISSARAIDAVRAFRFERRLLLPLLVERPIIALRWLIAGLDQLESTQRRIVRLMHRTVKEQIGELLLDDADRYGEVHLSQASIATLLGASRQSVNEGLAELKDAGVVETGYRRVRITDRAALERLVGRPG